MIEKNILIGFEDNATNIKYEKETAGSTGKPLGKI